MTKLESSMQGIGVAILYLYNSLIEDGIAPRDAKKEVYTMVTEHMKQLGYSNDDITIDVNKLSVISRLHDQISLLATSKQPHLSKQGKYLAELMGELLK